MKKTFFAAVFLSTTTLFAQTTAPTPVYSETMDVAAIRAGDEVPVTKTDIQREEIEARYHGQDVPLLMRDAPSINAYSESGNGGAGYSYISLRGIAPTRINFTLDGVPLADSEDMGTYFVDFPDLARSLESIQIQRGVGTSTFGSASFGGSVNLESIDLAQAHQLDVTLGAGSFGNQQVSVGYQSGALPGGFAFATRLSYLENEGFRDNSATRQHNLFFSGTKQLGDDAQLKLTGFSGHENQQLSFYATDEATLQNDLRSNPLRPEERDSFGYDLAQLQYIRALGSDSAMTASAYYQRGYGWYRLFDAGTDLLRQYGLDGQLLGTILTYEHRAGNITTNYGVHLNRFERAHTRDDLSLAARDYENDGVKGEANAFAKISYDTGRWNLYGDAQLRHATFDYHGTADIDSIGWTFFNPKIGARFALNTSSSVYASAGLSTREPTRNDMFQGEDDASVAHDLHAVHPERLLDFEAGWRYGTAAGSIVANVYAMEFHNEIASTGELSEIGLLLRRNVDRSHRRGIEVDATWRLSDRLQWRGTASLSHNRIDSWTQFFDAYDVDGNFVDSRPVQYDDVEPLLTPSVLIAQTLAYTPNARLSMSATARYVGRSWLDNTNDPDFDAPAFFLVDANVSYGLTSWMRVSLQVNNLLNADRVYPSGYSYRYYDGDARSGTAYYYPQAGRNAIVLMDLDW
jgi:iron complex outermembrane receptor protein